MNKTAYLSGPMRGFEQWNFPAFDRNAAFLRELGWTIISPAEVDRAIGFDETDPTAVFTDEDFQTAIRRDYVALTEADAIIFMPGWEKSSGARMESDFANVLKLDRYQVDVDNSYFEKEVVIALTGFARSGKDTIAKEFVNENNFERHGFSDSLKDILYALNPTIQEDTGFDFARLQYFIDEDGWEEAKKIKDIRQLLQRLGTEGGRVALGEDIWVNTLFSKPHKARLVIPDLRFENEAEEVRRRGGVVIRVVRDGVGPINDHASDQISFKADITVFNNGTPKEAYMEIVEQLPKFGINL